nr:hypothetical protein [Tanacetum cinerariifolium]
MCNYLSECIDMILLLASIVSLLLTPLCCDDTHDVTPRVSALAGSDRLEEEEEEEENEESEEEADSNLLLDARSKPGPPESGDSCESNVKPKRGPT